ncbi:acetyl xylan esterase [Streptomyces sp. CMB-StM0423]|uniref:acetyl xylan esterase n=1 Tax=Streptomyces sp. CMB-StM0423 TaxID=2059884 RepID=UPI000C7122B6|nr:acetyl xylan esterase [Streptomyces sp. CMB-StM0423]AUH44415.1 acetyl xylan esterase [Streptomyces sp. CMB-StM0423]
MSNGNGEAQIREVLSTFHPELVNIPADVDLIDSRLINSLAFITFMQNLIDATGREPDLDSVPIGKLRTIEGLTEIFFGSDAPSAQVAE